MDGPIIGAAAWAVEDPSASALLRDHDGVVWLRARPETLRARIGSGLGRRVEATDHEWLTRQASAREDKYAAVADLVINVDEKAPETVADDILGWWQASTIADR
jgi:shikimate kinase